MANNRMVLVCNVCVPKPNDWDYDKKMKGTLAIAKWYPAGVGIGEGDGSYYTNFNDLDDWGKRFFDFLTKHQHQEVPSKHYTKGAGQENPVRLEYESEGLP